MKIKKFNDHLPSFEQDPGSYIEMICCDLKIVDYTINEDWSIDVNNNVYLAHLSLNKIPLKFRNVIGTFECSYNKLTSFENAPKYVNGDFCCRHTEISSFRGFPESVGGDFFFFGSPIHEIYKLNPCKDFIEMVNEYDIIKDKNKVIEMRLIQALEDSECRNIPKEFKFENYVLI